VDSIGVSQAKATVREAGDVRRLALVEDHVARMWGGVRGYRRAEVAALRDWIRRVEKRIDENQGHLEALDRRVGDRLGALRDSLGASELRIQSNLDSRLAGEDRSRRQLMDRVAALDLRVDAMVERNRGLAWHRAARDVLTITSLGILIPHVLDHDGR
jgi:hypothetical protein